MAEGTTPDAGGSSSGGTSGGATGGELRTGGGLVCQETPSLAREIGRQGRPEWFKIEITLGLLAKDDWLIGPFRPED